MDPNSLISPPNPVTQTGQPHEVTGPGTSGHVQSNQLTPKKAQDDGTATSDAEKAQSH